MQVVQCEWILDVQLFNYHNPNNAERRPVGLVTLDCCCDTARCEALSIDLDQCPATCGVFFNVQLSDCQLPSDCFISTVNGSITDSPPMSPYGYIFSFTLDSIPDDVS